MSVLQLTRKCAWIMNEITRELMLGNLAERYSGDDPDQWSIMDDYWVICSKNDRYVADLLFTPTRGGNGQVRAIIHNAFNLVRPQHTSDFYPEQYGIVVKNQPDWKGETEPDLVVDWPLPDQIPISEGPRNHLPPAPRKTHIKVISSIH